MIYRKSVSGLLAAIAFCIAAPAMAAQLVTYSWTTTSQGFGPHVDQPTTATFQVPLSAVLSGKINYFDITNIQLSYPGLTFDGYSPTSIGLDNAAYVDPTTGKFIFHSNDQGLGVFAYNHTLFDYDTFLSITIDSSYDAFGQPLTSVADQFNASNGGQPYAGFPTAGYWTATFPVGPGGVPEPAAWALMIAGFGLVGAASRRRSTRITFA